MPGRTLTVRCVPQFDRDALARLCRRFKIRSLALFGSAARGESSPESDYDLLVDFEEGMTPGLGIITLTGELARIFERPVDLVTRRGLSPRVLERILTDARPLYHA